MFKLSTKKGKSAKEDVEHLETILASIQDAVIVADAEGTVLLANPTSEIITGYLPDELIGRPLAKAISFRCPRVDIAWFLKEAFSGERAVKLPPKCSIVKSSGELLPVAATATPLYNPKGEYTGVVFVIRNLAEELAAERKQYDFMSFVAHQLRTPVASFRLVLEAIMSEKERLKPNHQEHIEDLHKITKQLSNFIDELLDLSRFEAGEIDLVMKPVDLRKVVDEMAKSLKGLAISQNVTISLFPKTEAETSLMASGDMGRFHDVFSNLLTNAIRYNRPPGKVAVDAENISSDEIESLATRVLGTVAGEEALRKFSLREGLAGQKFLLISIADTGIGIPKAEQAGVFGNFFRGSNVRRKGLRGTGLGLSIVKTIVERFHGTIFFESQEDVGTTFYLVFPLLTEGPYSGDPIR